MSTIADELLADLLEDDSDVNSEVNSQDDELRREEEKDGDATMFEAEDQNALADAEDEDEAKAIVDKKDFSGINDVRSVAGLMKSLKPVLEKVEHYQSLPAHQQMQTIGSLEDNPEYKLLIESNYLSSSIDNEIIIVHKFIRDHYSVRFPELETMIQNPLKYAQAVGVIGNGPLDNASLQKIVASSDNILGRPLKQILDGPSLMVIGMEAIKTTGREMSSAQLEAILRACEMTIQLDKAKQTLTSYVQSRMSVFAPNLTVLIGSETAALLVNTAGGLKALAQIPACNVPSMGSKKQTFGMATNTRVRRQGYLYHSPIVQDIPMDLRNQAMRIVSAKLILAARCDMVHTTPNGSTGERLKEECLGRLDKLTAPAPNAGGRALPAPDDKPSRKRGGRRARKAKEQFAMTDLRKAQNRMAFGKEELEVGLGDETEGLGMIGSASSDGKIRATQIDQRTKAKLSKKNPGWGFESSNQNGLASSMRGFGQGAGNATVLQSHGLRSSGVGAAGAGTSSVIFSQHQGLELVNPKAKEEMERKRKAEEDGWFKSGTFTQLGTGSTPVAKSEKVDSGGFKVPALPAIKRLRPG